ncbi:MAG: hydantoinase/oxoprolinase family protein, partial [Candidatus Helarchaeales archaeon]
MNGGIYDLQVLGWDVGGVHVKASFIEGEPDEYHVKNILKYHPFWTKELTKLNQVLMEMHEELNPSNNELPMAITITAELSDAFQTKREGLSSIIKCFESTFSKNSLYFLNNEGRFLTRREINSNNILQLAATNWIATALIIGSQFPEALLVDIGSTTTDIIPIRNGKPETRGVTDMERLISRELIYTGALRATIPS